MTLTFLHARLATAVVAYMLIAGLWGLYLGLRRRGLGPNYWGVLAVGELLILAQLVLGVVLWLTGARPARSIHLLYGIVAAISLPGYYAYTKGRDDRRSALVYGILCLFLVGISLRAIGTA